MVDQCMRGQRLNELFTKQRLGTTAEPKRQCLTWGTFHRVASELTHQHMRFQVPLRCGCIRAEVAAEALLPLVGLLVDLEMKSELNRGHFSLSVIS